MPPKARSFYERCLKAELEAFYKARLGKDLPTGKDATTGKVKLLKKDLIALLEDIDRRPWKHGISFRFLDLPPEMRNLVYSEILPLSSTPDHALTMKEAKSKTQILRVCKQVNAEAEGILYNDRNSEMKITVHAWTDFIDRFTSVFSREVKRHWNVNDNSMAYNRMEWPEKLLKFKTVTIDVCTSASTSADQRLCHPVHQELYGASHFLSRSTALRAICLKVTEGDFPQARSEWLEALLPISRIGPNVSVEISGVSDEIKNKLLSEKEVINATDVLTDFFKIQAKLKDLKGFGERVDCRESLMTEINRQIEDTEQTLKDIRAVVDSDAESRIARATRRAKEFLAGDIVQKLHWYAPRKTKEIKRAARKQVDDIDGRQKEIKEFQLEAKRELADDTPTSGDKAQENMTNDKTNDKTTTDDTANETMANDTAA